MMVKAVLTKLVVPRASAHGVGCCREPLPSIGTQSVEHTVMADICATEDTFLAAAMAMRGGRSGG